MAVVDSDFLASVLTQFRGTFNDLFPAAVGAQVWPRLVMEVTSNTKTETHQWLGTVPKMQETTKNPLVIGGLEAYSYTMPNREFTGGFEVERNIFEDDKLGLIRPKISQLAQEPARHTSELVLSLFEDNPTAFDGTAFFANTRAIGKSANIDNILSGNYDGSIAEVHAGLDAARAQMRKFQDDHGRPYNLIGNVLVIPTELEGLFWRALNRSAGDGVNTPPQPADGSAGFWSASGYLVVVNPYLTSATDWYYLHVGGEGMRPFIFQNRMAPRMEGITNPDDSYVIENGKFLYTARDRKAVGVGDPRLAIKLTT